MPQDDLKKSKKVRIQGCLIKNSLSQPIPRGDSLPPFVVCPTVTSEVIKKRDRINFEQVENPHEKRAGKNNPEPAGIRQRPCPALRRRCDLPPLRSRSPFRSGRYPVHCLTSFEPSAFCCALRILSAS